MSLPIPSHSIFYDIVKGRVYIENHKAYLLKLMMENTGKKDGDPVLYKYLHNPYNNIQNNFLPFKWLYTFFFIYPFSFSFLLSFISTFFIIVFYFFILLTFIWIIIFFLNFFLFFSNNKIYHKIKQIYITH